MPRSIVDVLDQDEWWYAADGFPVRVDNMDIGYLRNLVTYLERHATHLRDRALWWETYNLTDEDEAIRRWRHEVDARSSLDWLNDRPLLRALRARLRRLSSVDGEVVDPDEPERHRLES